MRDHSQLGDPYGIAEEYTSQSFLPSASSPIKQEGLDVRGNALLVPRSLPTQAECDAIKGEA